MCSFRIWNKIHKPLTVAYKVLCHLVPACLFDFFADTLPFYTYPEMLTFSLFLEQAKLLWALVEGPIHLCMADLLHYAGLSSHVTSQGPSLTILCKEAFPQLWALSFIAFIAIWNYLLICWLVITGLIPLLAKLHINRHFASFTCASPAPRGVPGM